MDVPWVQVPSHEPVNSDKGSEIMGKYSSCCWKSTFGVEVRVILMIRV